jgi:hypothetical protein
VCGRWAPSKKGRAGPASRGSADQAGPNRRLTNPGVQTDAPFDVGGRLATSPCRLSTSAWSTLTDGSVGDADPRSSHKPSGDILNHERQSKLQLAGEDTRPDS